MSTRISTSSIHQTALAAMLQQQAALSRLQNQIASGTRVQTPADDPIAAVHILELQRTQSEATQFGKNSDVVKSRLTIEEQALGDTGTLLQQVQELTVQANSSTLSASDRQSIVTSLQSHLDELTAIANRKDGNGEYLFSGYATLTQPFSTDSSGNVAYAGDQGSRLLQISPSQRVADGHSGSDVFMSTPQGNGKFVTSANASNTGAGTIDVGTVTNAAAWVPDNYSVNFTSATTWEVRDSTNTLVTSGAYQAGAAIQFKGISVSITGTPASGDSFGVAKSGTENIFSTIKGVITSLQQPAGDDVGRAKLATALGGALQQLSQHTDHILSVRSEVGSRLSTLDDADTARDNQNLDLSTSISQLRDVDYATAVTQMNQQLLGLQAAQQSYTKISQLSLFNYL